MDKFIWIYYDCGLYISLFILVYKFKKNAILYIIDKIHLYDKIYAGYKMYHERDDSNKQRYFKIKILKRQNLKGNSAHIRLLSKLDLLNYRFRVSLARCVSSH